MTSGASPELKRIRKIILLAGTLVSALWFLWFFQIVLWYFKWGNFTEATFGVWGDSFGVLNGLFSALGFIGLLMTVWYQRVDMSVQQSLIAETKRDQYDQQAYDRDERHRQRFESSFFQLLALSRELRNEVKFKPSAGYAGQAGVSDAERTGGDAIKLAAEEIAFWINFHGEELQRDTQQLAHLYEERVHSQSEGGLGAFFRIVYTILRRVHDDIVLTENEKVSYGNLVRSQLTSAEIGLACVNSFSEFSNDFRGYLEHFRMPKYLPEGAIRDTISLHYPAWSLSGR